MKCGECQRLKDSDGRVGWCTARGRYRYLIEEIMGCPYFEERDMKKMCSFKINCQALKPVYALEEWEAPMTNKEKLNGLLTQVAELLKDDDVYPVEPFGHGLVEGGLTIVPANQFMFLNADSKHLSNLLAHIHQDGGHCESEHGAEKAVKDAIEKVGELLHNHPDTKRLDWLLGYISFETFDDKRYAHVCIEPPAELDLRWRLERAWRQIESDDPRAIIDKAMEEDGI